jgi:chromate transport protein ChrA
VTEPNATDPTGPMPAGSEAATGRPHLGTFLRYFLRLGTFGFGGPIAIVGYMQRDLVEKHGWISKQDFLDGVALGQTMPGPLAAQVAMWVGYLKRGPLGAAATALAFIGLSFVLVTAVAAVYAHYSGLAIVASLFYGIAPAVMAIITIAAYKLVRLARPSPTRPPPPSAPSPSLCCCGSRRSPSLMSSSRLAPWASCFTDPPGEQHQAACITPRGCRRTVGNVPVTLRRVIG